MNLVFSALILPLDFVVARGWVVCVGVFQPVKRSRVSLSGVTLSRTTSSGNSVRNLLSSHSPPSTDAMPFATFLSSDSEMPTTSVLWYSVLCPSFRKKPSVQCVVFPLHQVFLSLSFRFPNLT